jgi:hypothetical protein
MAKIARSLPKVTPWSLDKVVMSYHGSKRRRYEEAAREYRAYGLTKDQAGVKMFIKCEKIKFSEDKENPDPRAIQYRNPVFAVAMAQYIKAIEEVVYQLRGNRMNNLPRTRVFGKNLNSKEKAELLYEKMQGFDKPVVMSLDASRFDQHFDVGHLLLLHKFYLTLLNDPFFRWTLSCTIKNKVVSTKGLKYTAKGGRMSGDMDTALGACLLMFNLLGCFFEGKNIKWDCLDDGDDILLIIEESAFKNGLSEQLTQHFYELGQVIKVENVTTEIEKVVWCQASPVMLNDGYKFIRNPSKVLSGALVGPKWTQMHSEAARRALTNTIGLGEAHLNRGVPVLQAFAHCLIRNAATTRQVKIDRSDSLFYKVRHELGKTQLLYIPPVEPGPISDQTRQSFADAFGITVTEQLHYEKYFESWKINFGQPTLQLPPVDVRRWYWEAFNDEKY